MINIPDEASSKREFFMINYTLRPDALNEEYSNPMLCSEEQLASARKYLDKNQSKELSLSKNDPKLRWVGKEWTGESRGFLSVKSFDKERLKELVEAMGLPYDPEMIGNFPI